MAHPYKDNPHEIEEWLQQLPDDEQSIFDLGYICALEGLLEQIVDSKIKIWNKMMGASKREESHLQSRIYILDIYEKHFQRRIDRIAERQASKAIEE